MRRRQPPAPTKSISLRRLLNQVHRRGILLAMILAATAWTVFGVLALRSYAHTQLQLMAYSLSLNLEAAVVFSDAEAAHESLEQIAARSDVAQARVIGRDGKVLAQWNAVSDDYFDNLEYQVADFLLPQPLITPIEYQGQPVGSLALSSQGAALTRFLRNGAIALLCSLLLGAMMSYLSARRLRNHLMQPLSHLSHVAETIARERTFKQRVPPANIAELDDIAENFNRLLDELESWQNHLQRENASLAHQACHDSLTGLPNRAQFELVLARTLRESAANSGQFALMFLDCNRFKQINDELGHAAGDTVLVTIAQRLTHQLREDDLVSRLGGDEFAVLLKPVYDEHDVTPIAEKILASMDEPVTLSDGRQIDVSLSIGVALYPRHADDLTNLLHHADVAMYTAKRSGSGYRYATGGIHPPSIQD